MRRLRRAGLLGIAALLAWWAWPTDPPAEPGGGEPRPAPRAAAAAGRRSAPAEVADEADEEEDEEEERHHDSLVLYVRGASEGLLVVPKVATLDPRAFLEDDGLARELADLSLEAWEAVAAEVDPLVALEVERLRALDAWEADWLDALGDLDATSIVAPDALVGPPEVGVLLDHAEALATAGDASELEADVSALYVLDALRATGRTAEAREVAEDLLGTAGDAVAAQAAALLTRLPRGRPLPPELLDRLADLGDAGADPRDLAALGLDHALRAGDEARAQAWVDRLEAAVDAACDRSALGDDPRCATDASNVDDTLGRLGLRDPADADDWHQAFEIAAFTCAWETRSAPMAIEGTAAFDRTWTFGPWTESSAFTACLEREATSGPEPEEEPLEVQIRVVQP